MMNFIRVCKPHFASGWSACLLACVALGLTGCAFQGELSWSSYGPGSLKAGDSEGSVLQQMGSPTQRLTLTSGHRLVFVRGPYGRHTWFVDVGADGRVQSVVQTLSAGRFAAVKPGMTQDELLAWLGPASESRGLAIEGRKLWFWRFETNDCLLFATTLSRDGRVLDAGEMPDPMCEAREPKDPG